MANIREPPLVAGLSALAADYRALLCDVWGVVHDGIRAFPAATEALRRYRRDGGAVLLLTNAPRPKAEVVVQLDRFGVPRDAYDDVITSGEVARVLLARSDGVRVYHVGPERDLPLYDGLNLDLVGEEGCELICCTGLVDDRSETPDDYGESIARWRKRDLPMLCANPDIVVSRGHDLVWCAGAIAERYREVGGQTTVVGKPHPEIYELAQSRVGSARPMLALGDGVHTDVRGAVRAGIDVVFVTDGIHAAAFGPHDRPDVAAVHAFLAEAGLGARALMVRLVWDH
jgi:HAD superfamily hydrolase (TIGR01459 family)